ncbi:diguanylate cyclase [uncultured Tateyamaria sp.]|uniref:diguanylate cyclase n=2 Tax=uncultured Tateyamaria sp. TaxID=455651 RepID=UPI00261B5BDB|nr:diguanylate cyclase [uncultured Tateyamaria sp.]
MSMHGKILVVDPIATNRIVLRVKLAASHYDMVQAGSIGDAMRVLGATVPDMILCADTLPDGGPLRLMARLRKAGLQGKVPVIVLGTDCDIKTRLKLLGAGIEDVLEKPIDDSFLLARVRSVIRAFASATEWKLRDGTSRALGFAEPNAQFAGAQTVRIVAQDQACLASWHPTLAETVRASLSRCTPAAAVERNDEANVPDGFILLVEPEARGDMLGLLATIRSNADTRHSAILVVQVEPDCKLGAQMLDMGANDVMAFHRDSSEVALRLETLLSRKRMSDALRDTVRTGIEAALIDPLTGLHNRRYAMPHLARIAERAVPSGKPFAVMVADMDHFKRINDTFGHAAGDAVLVETAQRLRENMRAVDMVARIGGEEFLIVMPGAGLADAKNAAQRLCRIVRDTPFDVPGQAATAVNATISIGMTVCDPAPTGAKGLPSPPETLLDRADKALYAAKADGRNRVTLSRPAA